MSSDTLAASATVQVLTAVFALHHALAMTPEDSAAIQRLGARLSPGMWARLLALLRDVEGLPPGAEFELACPSLIARWLGCRDEAAFANRYGVSMCDALARDSRELAGLARGLEDPDAPLSEADRRQITAAWCGRAHRLLAGVPWTGRSAIDALEQALVHCPPEDCCRSQIYWAIAYASASVGDDDGVARAQDRLAELRALELDPAIVAHATSARILTVLWCVAHDAYLLDGERGLDEGVCTGPALWELVRTCVERRRFDELPMPAGTLTAWFGPLAGTAPDWSALPLADGVSVPEFSTFHAEVLRLCLERTSKAGLLAEMASVVEAVWSGSMGPAQEPSEAAQCVVAAVCARRIALVQGWTPVGACCDPWFEVHQGARRPEVVNRVAVIEALHSVLVRAGAHDPACEILVWLDRAAACEATGRVQEQREALDMVDAISERFPPGHPSRGQGRVPLALFWWGAGDPEAARRCLENSGDPRADAVLQLLDDRADEHAYARRVEETWEARGDIRSGCEAAWAHEAAGHHLRARDLAREVVNGYPRDPAAWGLLASVLTRQGRYRDAQNPSETAHKLGLESHCSQRLFVRLRLDLGRWSAP